MAVSGAAQSRREGPTGDFYRKVVLQRNGMHLGRSTQGHYVFSVDGELLRGSNNRDLGVLKRQLDRSLARDASTPRAPDGLLADDASERKAPAGTRIVEVYARVLEADWPAPSDEAERYQQIATGRDFLWITSEEEAALTGMPASFPRSLAQRLARFHIIDNTRCQGLEWNRGDIHELRLTFMDETGAGGGRGRAVARTADDRRGYVAEIGGEVLGQSGRLERFDLVIRATFEGDGKWSTGAPAGD